MRVGIIAEGRGDLPVLANILKGKLGIDGESIQYIRPEYSTDETDLYEQRQTQFGGSSLVRQECIDGSRIREFLDSPIDEGPRLVVVHIDTAEIGRADSVIDVERPETGAQDYVDVLRARVVAKINQWLGGRFVGQIRHAVAIEETEAWVLALFVSADTARHRNPKEALRKWINGPQGLSPKQRKQLYQMPEYEMHDTLSKDFRRTAKLQAATSRNRSLASFVATL